MLTEQEHAQLRPGARVVKIHARFSARTDKSIETVERVTPSGQIVLNNNERYNKEGRAPKRAQGKWDSGPELAFLTPAREAEIKYMNDFNYVASQSHNFGRLSAAAIHCIADMIREDFAAKPARDLCAMFDTSFPSGMEPDCEHYITDKIEEVRATGYEVYYDDLLPGWIFRKLEEQH